MSYQFDEHFLVMNAAKITHAFSCMPMYAVFSHLTYSPQYSVLCLCSFFEFPPCVLRFFSLIVRGLHVPTTAEYSALRTTLCRKGGHVTLLPLALLLPCWIIQQWPL